MSGSPQILVVDDDQGVRRSLTLLLRGHGYRTKAYADGAALAGDPEAAGASLLLADYRMPAGDGFDLLEILRGRGWNGAAVMITGHGSEWLRADAARAGFDGVIEKPLRPNLLLAAARRAVGPSGPISI
jgi:FixJ family two-component response regulator